MIESIRELFKYRALISALVARHLATRYRGSALGFLWSLLNPLCLMLVYTLVFRYYIRFDGVANYPIFLFCGLLPWIWFTTSLSEGVNSLVSSGHLITKSMFPAHVLPVVAGLSATVNFLLSLPILFIFMLIAGVPFHLSLVTLPAVLLIQFIFMLGLSLTLSALNVRFRDVQHLVQNALTFLFFLSPIVYPASSVPERFKFTMDLNPLALLTTFYHQIILEGVFPSLQNWAFLCSLSLIVLILGFIVFNRSRESFAELL